MHSTAIFTACSLVCAAAAAASSPAPADLGFEEFAAAEAPVRPWEVSAYGYDVGPDHEVTVEGAASLRIRSGADARSAMVRQLVPGALVHDNAMRLTGSIRTREVSGTATLFVVVNGEAGRIFLDDMGGRPVTGDAEWTAVEIVVPKLPTATSVEFGALVIGSGTAWFDGLGFEALDATSATSDAARAYLQQALDIIERRAIYRDNVDWQTVRPQVEAMIAGAQAPADTYPAIRFALFSLGDRHSSLISPPRAAQLTGTDGGPESSLGWESPSGALLENRIGYVSVPKFIGTSPERQTRFADELQAVIEDIDTERICGWIVDLRNNLGGSVFPMLAGIGPILGEGDAGGGVAADGETVMRSYQDGRAGKASVSGEPYRLIKPMPVVAVIIGPDTSSSGEALALAFVGRPNTQTFGLPTAGYTTGNVPQLLSDGAILNLAVTHMTDRTGTVYRGRIEPDVRVEDDAALSLNNQAVIRRAITWIQSTEGSCSPGPH